jgi:hypothetical protein
VAAVVLELLEVLRQLPQYRAALAASVLCGRAALAHIMAAAAAAAQVRPALAAQAAQAAAEMVLPATLRLVAPAAALLVIQVQPTPEAEVVVRGILQHPVPQAVLA